MIPPAWVTSGTCTILLVRRFPSAIQGAYNTNLRKPFLNGSPTPTRRLFRQATSHLELPGPSGLHQCHPRCSEPAGWSQAVAPCEGRIGASWACEKAREAKMINPKDFWHTRSLGHWFFFGGQGLPTVWPRGHWVEGEKEKNLPLWRLQLLISRLVLSCSEPSILTAPGTRWMVVISVPQTRKHWHPTSSLHNQHLTATPVTWTSPLSVLDNHPSGWKLWSSHVTQFWVTLDLGTWLASLSSRLAKMKLNGMVNHYCWSHHFRLPRDIAISGACLASPGILMLFHL